MRPIGDSTPDDHLKEERWLDEYIANMYPKLETPIPENEGNVYYRQNPIDLRIR
jgi:hypothetical protein